MILQICPLTVVMLTVNITSQIEKSSVLYLHWNKGYWKFCFVGKINALLIAA